MFKSALALVNDSVCVPFFSTSYHCRNLNDLISVLHLELGKIREEYIDA